MQNELLRSTAGGTTEDRMTDKPYRPQHDIVTLMTQFQQEVSNP